jgi:hypothetical protein
MPTMSVSHSSLNLGDSCAHGRVVAAIVVNRRDTAFRVLHTRLHCGQRRIQVHLLRAGLRAVVVLSTHAHTHL